MRSCWHFLTLSLPVSPLLGPGPPLHHGDCGWAAAEGRLSKQTPVTYDVVMTDTETRAPLNRERIIDAAVSFADENGVEELSMRKLGAELGVEAMSLYNHVENKDDIFDGMIDHVFASVPVPDTEADWKVSIRDVALKAMDQFTAHPWTVNLLMQRGSFGNSSLLFMDRVLGLLRNAGFSDEDTHHAWQMLASHTMGCAFQQASGGFKDKDWDGLEQQLSRLGEEYPNVADLAPYLGDCEFGAEFAFGLVIIIDGLDTRLH
jgi:AcrR family transcriptional regulator